MKGYGLPRHLNVEFPDKAYIRYYGLKTEFFKEKVPAVKKNAARRYWKKRLRMQTKETINALVSQLAEEAR